MKKRIFSVLLRVTVLAAALSVILLLSVKGYQFGKNVFDEREGVSDHPYTVTVTVDSGENIRQVAEKLKKEGLIDSSLVLIAQKYFYGKQPEGRQLPLKQQHDRKDDPGCTFRCGCGYRGSIMIVDERTITYINSLEQGDSEFLRMIAKEAAASFVPIIRKETGSLLKTLVEMKRPRRILEVGTATGYSALLMSEHMPGGSTITTIEKYEKRIPIARENFRRGGKEDVITLLPGDAAEILKSLSGPYDFIFMDAAKGQYIHFLPEVLAAHAGWRRSGVRQCASGRRSY